MLLTLLQFFASKFLVLALHLEAGSFPRPLSPQEEIRAFADLRAGDSSAREKLIRHNLRLVAHIAKKYYALPSEQDDLISIGTIGLIKAVGTFDYTKGTRFATYASRCIENEILMHFRASKKTAQDVSISDPIDTDKEGNPLTLMDVISEDDTILDDLDLKLNTEKLYRYIQESLDDREQEIIEWRYGLIGDGLTQREVAKKLNISRSYVSQRRYCKQISFKESPPSKGSENEYIVVCLR